MPFVCQIRLARRYILRGSGCIGRASSGGVRLCPPVGLLEGANQLGPRNSAQHCDGGTDGKRPPETSRAVHDKASEWADDNAGDIAQTVLHASPFARRRRSGQRPTIDAAIDNEQTFILHL